VKARSAKAKGTRLEKWLADRLASIGISSRRQPGSGIYESFPHDVAFTLGSAEGIEQIHLIAECKSWKDGWRTGDKAMGAANVLVIKRDRGEPRVYMDWETFELFAASTHQLLSTVINEGTKAETDMLALMTSLREQDVESS